jgi:hypothetical protein
MKKQKMDEESLLSHLQAQEQDSATFTWGRIGAEREKSMREYFRQPYGTEEEGWSSIVTSEVQDAVEWMLPSLLKIFTSTEKAVSFEPNEEKDVDGAEQATDACNYVFFKQNNGFLTLYTAFKDALISKNCAVMWRKETKRTKVVTPATNATHEMLAMLLQEAGKDAEIESATPNPPTPMMGPGGPVMDPHTGQPMMGPPTFNARICAYQEKTYIRVEAFAPEDLRVKRDWTTPLLDNCPYVARDIRVTLSDLHEMGFTDVEPEDLLGSDDAAISSERVFRANRSGSEDLAYADQSHEANEDPSLTRGFLRLEYVLVDFDGDGIAERREIYRLKTKILRNEECAQVPIATASPILVPHRWDGMSVAETMSDLQQLKTELTRQMLNSAYLANNPRTKVLTDSNWSPRANVDDLLDSRPGAILRQMSTDAIQEHITPFVGGQMLPLLDYVDHMGERRTGVSYSHQSADPNALRNDKTAVEVQQTANALAARVDLIARILAELLVKPIFKGILRLLTDGDMENIAFKLRDKFVNYDPNEWLTEYDMTINVGLGTGDRNQQLMHLQTIFQQQGVIGASPVGSLLIEPKNIYNTLAKIVENAGFKNVGDFYKDPQGAPMPQAPPDPKMQIAQMQMQGDSQKSQAEAQGKFQLEQMKDQLAANRDHQKMMMDQQASHQQANLDAQLQAHEQTVQAQQNALQNHLEAQREQQKAMLEAQLEEQRRQSDERLSQMEQSMNLMIAHINNVAKVEVAEISANTSLQAAQISAARQGAE